MNMKKTFAGAMAGALAVSAMATSASASIPGPGEYTIDLTKEAEFYATVQFTFDADYMLDADATSLDLAINSTVDTINPWGGIKELTVDVLGSTGTKTQTLKYNSTWNDVNFYDWYIGATMSIPVKYAGAASNMQALYADKYTTVENALAVNAADGSKKLPKNIEFTDGKHKIVDKYDLDFPYFDKIVVTAKIPCTKSFTLDALNGIGDAYKTKVTASLTGVHDINIYQINDNESDKVADAEAKLEAFTKIFGTSHKSAAKEPTDTATPAVTGVVAANGTTYATYVAFAASEGVAKTNAENSAKAKETADVAVTLAQADVTTAYAALKLVDAKAVKADGSGAAADSSQNVKVPAAGTQIEGAVVVKDATTGAVTDVSTTVAYTDEACTTKDDTVNAAAPLALTSGAVYDYIVAVDALTAAKTAAATAATAATKDAATLTSATANATAAKAAVVNALKTLGIVDDKGAVAKDYADVVVKDTYLITPDVKFVKLYNDTKLIVDNSEGSFVGVEVSDSKTVAAETLFTKFEANKIGLRSGITIDNKVVKTVSGDLRSWKPDALRQIADAVADNSGVTLTFTAKDNFDDAAYKSWIKYVEGVNGFDSWAGSDAWGTDNIKDSYETWGVSMFTGAIVLNRDFSKQFSASGLVDWGTNSITFDWDELTEGRFYDASVVLHDLELLSTQNVEWLSCTVTVPEQEASADDADSSQGKTDDSNVIDDTPVESEVITEAPVETEAPATEAAPAETTAVAPVDNVKTGNAPVALAVIPVALAAAAIIAKKRG